MIEIKKFKTVVNQINENLIHLKKYGVPYDPPTIGFERSKPKGYEEELERLAQAMEACIDCPLGLDRKRRKAKVVPGGGNPDALVMIVGEGPGKMEERYKGPEAPPEYGFPFVGLSGQELDRILKYLGLNREDLFFSNIVHCRATEKQGWELKDRGPSVSEVDACHPFLIRQIELVQPWIILAFGKYAATALLQVSHQTPISELKDELRDYPRDTRIKVWGSYHPAYLLRSPEERIGVALQFKHLKAILKKSGI